MITNPIDYYNKIQQIKDLNKPQYAVLLPVDENTYEIDLNTRTVKAPKFLSVKTDHYAETIYFVVDRFYDNMDLADTVCTIQYLNSGIKDDPGEMYLVPFYDITTLKDEGKILFPWQISGEVTKALGTLTFSFRFFKLNEKGEYIYSLNTIPASSQILNGLDLKLDTNDGFYVPADIVTQIYNEIDKVSRQTDLYWIEI